MCNFKTIRRGIWPGECTFAVHAFSPPLGAELLSLGRDSIHKRFEWRSLFAQSTGCLLYSNIV